MSTPRTLLGWVLTVVVPVLVADQCLKVWVKLNFSLGERMAFIPGLLELQFIENEGMAFGWALPGMAGKLVLTGFRLVAAVGIGLYIKKLIESGAHQGFLTCLAFIWAGAIGNIIDSAVYGQLFTASHWGLIAEWAGKGYAPFMMGHVVDMFHFHGALAVIFSHRDVGQPRGVSAHLESGGCRHFVRRHCHFDWAAGVFCRRGNGVNQSCTTGSTQSPWLRINSMRASTARSSGTFFSTTSFSLYKVILPGPVPT